MNDMTAWGHILLAEDNAVNQRVTRAMLEHLGFHVDVVADGAAAVDAAAVTPYRTILLDSQLPVLDAYLAATEIRRWQGASRHAPIIAVTASMNDADELRCLAAGIDDYVVKPFTTQGLADVLARWAPDEHSAATADTVRLPVHAEPESADLPALDATIVERLERLGEATGEDLMGQLTVLFLSDADAHVAEMRRALATDDVSALIRCAHTLTGASGNLGATRLAALFAGFSTEGTATDPVEGGLLLDAIEAELDRVRCALDARMLTS